MNDIIKKKKSGKGAGKPNGRCATKQKAHEKKNANAERNYPPSVPVSLVPPRTAYQTLDRLVFEVIARLEDRSVHFLHRITELDAKPRQNVSLPRVVPCVDPRLDLFVIDHADAKLLLRLRRVERRARALDLRQELLPVRERVAQPVEDVFGLEVPEGLELQPFGHVVL
jgi:hypothetical protein